MKSAAAANLQYTRIDRLIAAHGDRCFDDIGSIG
jgi:hypothetical protein